MRAACTDRGTLAPGPAHGHPLRPRRAATSRCRTSTALVPAPATMVSNNRHHRRVNRLFSPTLPSAAWACPCCEGGGVLDSPLFRAGGLLHRASSWPPGPAASDAHGGLSMLLCRFYCHLFASSLGIQCHPCRRRAVRPVRVFVGHYLCRSLRVHPCLGPVRRRHLALPVRKNLLHLVIRAM